MNKNIFLSKTITLISKLFTREGVGEICSRAVSGLYTHSAVRRIACLFYGVPSEPAKWIFIIGCYNSGTTILREIVGAHSSVASMPREGVRFSNLFPTPEKYGWYRMTHRCLEGSMIPNIGDAVLVRKMLLRDWCPWMNEKKTHFLEKSISHSARLDWIKKIFPDAKFLVIHRECYSSAEGIRRKARATGKAKLELGGDIYDIEDCAKEWDYLNRSIIEFKNKAGDLDMMSMRYEDICTNPKKYVKEILDFLEVAAEDYIDLGGSTFSVGGRTFDLVNMNSASHNRLSEDDVEKIETISNSTMNELGYIHSRNVGR